MEVVEVVKVEKAFVALKRGEKKGKPLDPSILLIGFAFGYLVQAIVTWAAK